MIDYTIYDVSGEIIKSGSTSQPDLSHIELQSGESILEVAAPIDPHLYRVLSGQIIRKSEEEISQINAPKEAALFKGTRNIMLAECDWTQAADSPLSEAKKAEWATYRQQLRDLPANTSDPANPTWPTPPS